jgi:hypothetical protein
MITMVVVVGVLNIIVNAKQAFLPLVLVNLLGSLHPAMTPRTDPR